MSAQAWLRRATSIFTLPVSVLLLGAACTRTPAAVNRPLPDAAEPAPGACTLATPLVAGIPGSPGHLMPSTRNPNGQSELSGVMRTMQADLAAARTAITGQAPLVPMRARHEKLRCAWPTNPSDRDAQFDANARVYLDAVAALESAAPASRAPAFDGVLNACKACHELTCSGAIVAIEALRLPATATAVPAKTPQK